jgi:hypothetical protein
MKIKEVLINNKAIEKISYYAIDKDDSQMLAIKNKIHAVWNNHFIDRRGYKKYIEACFLDVADADVITINTYFLEDRSSLMYYNITTPTLFLLTLGMFYTEDLFLIVS